MSLELQAVLIGLVAFFGYMHNYTGSSMVNRPIVMSTLTGLVLGDIQTGIVCGATLELAFLGAVPIGASNPPDMCCGSIIGTSFVILSGASVGTALALAIPVATLSLMINNLQMMFLLTWIAHYIDKVAETGDANKVEKLCRWTAILSQVLAALIVSIGFYVGIGVIEDVIAMIPEWITHGMDVTAGILPAVGFAMLARMILTKELTAFLLIGFLLTAYLGVPVFGVALFGLGIALIVYFKKEATTTMEVDLDDNEF